MSFSKSRRVNIKQNYCNIRIIHWWISPIFHIIKPSKWNYLQFKIIKIKKKIKKDLLISCYSGSSMNYRNTHVFPNVIQW
jgi:hypothetical protein